jgi:hypothetical protein
MKEVAKRAMATGEPCWFAQYGRCNFDGAPFDWGPSRGPLSFTTHHVERCMDGGDAIPNSDKLVPSHRSCNSSDGLRAQNARRAAERRGEPYDPDEQAVIEALSDGLPRPGMPVQNTSRDW